MKGIVILCGLLLSSLLAIPAQSAGESGGEPTTAERIAWAEEKLAAAETAEERVAAQGEIGHARLAAGEYEKARAEYEKALAHAGEDQPPWLRARVEAWIADSYLMAGEYAKAEAGYRQAEETGPGHPSLAKNVAARRHVSGRLAAARKIMAVKKELAETEFSSADARVMAQVKIGHAWKEIGEHERARVEYRKLFQHPARNQLDLRATIETWIADSYLSEKDYARAEEAYLRAQRMGSGGGWRVDYVRRKLEEVREHLAAGQED